MMDLIFEKLQRNLLWIELSSKKINIFINSKNSENLWMFTNEKNNKTFTCLSRNTSPILSH